MARIGRATVLLAAAMAHLAFGEPSYAQETGVAGDRLDGQVVLDGRPVPGIDVTLHRVTSESSGQVAAGVTDPTGSFSFPREAPDGEGFDFYFVTANYSSVNFFGPFVRPGENPAPYLVTVYDTTSVLPEPVRLAARHIVMVPEATGSWEVNEIVDVLNPTSRALVAADRPSVWEFGLPEGATDFEVGPGDVLPHEIAFMNGKVLHLTPVIPGSREVFLRYRLPRDVSPTVLSISEATDTLHIYVQQPSHLTGVNGIQSQKMVEVGEERYLQYSAIGVGPGHVVELRWTRRDSPIDPVVAAVVLTVGLLLVATVVAIRNRSPEPVPRES